MLTEQERAWLERRKNPCVHCVHNGRTCDTATSLPEGLPCEWFEFDVEDPDYQDAAEFEARVAALLAKDTRTGCLRPSGCFWLTKNKYRTQCPPKMDRPNCNKIHCSLYLARIAAEKEMGDWD